ncbi:conserved exported hypothetical protein [Luteimonas sp. 9C]|uniref:DUF4426 domain-containing protein n=1 Tax=Luteimonas sp. 9C TaxID=2653148 RepID=UPI0012F30B73|nr:DUF4426 domain-containing protein [Luteimonas sp. 9C]VXB86265.1 conserved exported hypothetical protein [Luteimonas sp. 9C]
MIECTRALCLAGLALLATACGQAPSDAADAQAAAQNAAMPAQTMLGDAEVMASVVPAAHVGAAVAKRYAIEPARDRALVLVSVQRGDVPVPVQITGEARDLRGVRQTLAFDAVDLDGRVEHVAVARVSGPDTLRLDLRITAEDGARATLRFNRDLPR